MAENPIIFNKDGRLIFPDDFTGKCYGITVGFEGAIDKRHVLQAFYEIMGTIDFDFVFHEEKEEMEDYWQGFDE